LIAVAACAPSRGADAPTTSTRAAEVVATSEASPSSPRPSSGASSSLLEPASPLLPNGREVASEPVPVEGDLVRGRATVLVDSPLERARVTVLTFTEYTAFMPHYRSSRVLDRTADRTQVYMQVAALGGLVKMGATLWFPKSPVAEGAWLSYASTFDSGNVEDFKAVWRLRAKSPAQTYLSLEVFVKPRLPLPKTVLDDENMKGARDDVEAMRRRIEGA
jgi:ribosome-associated toxin RatA of RatAB toxin-antitoxin module